MTMNASDARTNTPVQTPNGDGVIQGRMDDNGVIKVIVRQKLPDTPNPVGEILTPAAIHSALIAYLPEQLEIIHAYSPRPTPRHAASR
jgi:hypothetical protein